MSYSQLVLILPMTVLLSFIAADESTTKGQPGQPDDSEIAKLFQADQSSRANFLQMKPEQLTAMLMNDRERRTRARELYRADSLKTAADFYHAAMIFQHGEQPEDFLLAHELSVAALALGHDRARWLAAATEDRFLRSIGRNQRFGTQFGKGDGVDDKWRLFPVDPDVADSLRKVLQCPTLNEAKRKAEELNQKAASTAN